MVATKEMCVYCFDSLVGHFEETPLEEPKFPDDKYPLFVSWHSNKIVASGKPRKHMLRGCKGTFTALRLHDGLAEFSLISAFKDSRFKPIANNELLHLECAVNLLFQFEEATDVWDWDIGTHGIIIDFVDPHNGKKRNATYLPAVAPEQKWNKKETIESLIAKAGFEGTVTKLLLESMKVTRYQSSEVSLTYEEYLAIKNGTSPSASEEDSS